MKNTLQDALKKESPLSVVGVINAYTAIMAEKTGFKALYISGAGVANASYGLPDLGMTSLDNVLEDVRRISSASSLPILVDADTGWGGAFNIANTVKQMQKAGASGIHIEDQVSEKRCGHRPNKQIVTSQEMCDRIKSAVDGKDHKDFVIMARTDALANEGMDKAIERTHKYIECGADMIFAEAVTTLEDYKKFSENCKVPILANITEFGATPIFNKEELEEAGVELILYPLSAFRAMNQAALRVYDAIRHLGTQEDMISAMQTREELYSFLDYHSYEKKLDKLFF